MPWLQPGPSTERFFVCCPLLWEDPNRDLSDERAEGHYFTFGSYSPAQQVMSNVISQIVLLRSPPHDDDDEVFMQMDE